MINIKVDQKSGHLTVEQLAEHLQSRKAGRNPKVSKDSFKEHIDGCVYCWSLWNKVRWDQAKGTSGYEDLKEYLGDDFSEYYDSSWELAIEWYAKDRDNPEKVKEFYKNTPNYAYNSMIHYESGDRDRYDQFMKDLVKKHQLKSVVDYGCGVGTDSLILAKLGLETYVIDFDCPATQFLRWRIDKHQLDNLHFLDVEKVTKLPAVDMLWAFDVFEHLEKPHQVIEMLSPQTRVFCHKSDNDDDANGRHPFHYHFDEKLFSQTLTNKGFHEIESGEISIWLRD
jgi:2-polyprenyl-3-methyl-5-hydroxy-6-metoxy-1,4-benzoquinol methylase